MDFKRFIAIFLIISLSAVTFAEKAYYSVSPFSGGLPSSSIQKTSDSFSNESPKDSSSITAKDVIIVVCAVTLAVVITYGIYKMKADNSSCSEAYCDDCADSLKCNDKCWDSLANDCSQGLADSCSESLSESCKKNNIISMLKGSANLIPTYVH